MLHSSFSACLWLFENAGADLERFAKRERKKKKKKKKKTLKIRKIYVGVCIDFVYIDATASNLFSFAIKIKSCFDRNAMANHYNYLLIRVLYKIMAKIYSS